jgi:hypothetical protein
MMKSAISSCLALLLAVFAVSPRTAFAAPESVIYDPTFAGGSVLDDLFAESSAANTLPQKSAMLSNGDVLTVGIVPAVNSTLGGNLGLVHYGSSGERIGWPAPSAAYASYFNIYLTFPNSTTNGFIAVNDVKVAFGDIYALVSSEANAYIVAFSEGGTFVGYYDTLPGGYPYGVALVPYTDGTHKWLLVISNTTDSNLLAIQRFIVGSNGSLSADTTYSGQAGGISTISIPGCSCDALGGRDAKAVRTATSTPTLYVVGLANGSTPGGFVMVVNGATGLLSSARVIDNADLERLAVVDGGSTAADVLYILDDNFNAGTCSGSGRTLPTYGVRKLFASSLQADSAFGISGVASFTSPHYCMDGLPYKPEAFILAGQRIVVSGYDTTFFHSLGSGSYYDFDPLAVTLRLSDGTQTGFNRIPALQSNGAPWGDAQFSDVVAQDSAHFVTSGALGYPPFTTYPYTYSASYRFGTSRLVGDDIFEDGFDVKL